MPLALDVGFTGLSLGVKGVEGLLQTLFGGFAGIDSATNPSLVPVGGSESGRSWEGFAVLREAATSRSRRLAEWLSCSSANAEPCECLLLHRCRGYGLASREDTLGHGLRFETNCCGKAFVSGQFECRCWHSPIRLIRPDQNLKQSTLKGGTPREGSRRVHRRFVILLDIVIEPRIRTILFDELLKLPLGTINSYVTYPHIAQLCAKTSPNSRRSFASSLLSSRFLSVVNPIQKFNEPLAINPK